MAHRNREAFELGHQPGEEFHLRRGDVRVAHHFAHGIAAVGGVDQRQLFGVLPQKRRDAFQDLRALGRQHARPLAKAGSRARHRGIDVGGRRHCNAAERLAAAGARELRVPAGARRVPAAAVVQVAVRG